MKKYSNVLVPCPYAKGNYSIVNIPADAFKFPPIVPAGEYRVDTRMYDGGKETYLFVKVYALIQATGAHVLKMK